MGRVGSALPCSRRRSRRRSSRSRCLRGWLAVPPEWSPWAPLDLDAAPNLLTRHKLEQLSDDGELCARVLAQADDDLPAVTRRGHRRGVRLARCRHDRADRERGRRAVLADVPRGRVARALGEAHAWRPQPSGTSRRRCSGSSISAATRAAICTAGRTRTRSRHATAEAFDVAGFVLADGRRIRVLGDWNDELAPRQASCAKCATAPANSSTEC